MKKIFLNLQAVSIPPNPICKLLAILNTGSQGAFCSYFSFSQSQDLFRLFFVFSLCPKHGSGVGATPQVDVCSCQKKFLVTKSAINYCAEHCVKISFLVKNLNLFCHL